MGVCFNICHAAVISICIGQIQPPHYTKLKLNFMILSNTSHRTIGLYTYLVGPTYTSTSATFVKIISSWRTLSKQQQQQNISDFYTVRCSLKQRTVGSIKI